MNKKSTPLPQSGEAVKEMADTIVDTFSEFKVPVDIVKTVDGYRNYHFYLQPKNPMRMKAFGAFVDDLKYALSNDGVQIQAPIPNEKMIGVTVPKKGKLPEVLHSEALAWSETKTAGPMSVPLGIDELGGRHLLNICEMSHGLIGGATSSGKSALLHSIINSLIEKNHPDDLRLILIDTKRVELTLYKDLPHLLTPPITQSKRAVQALSWAVKEMERRFDILESERVQNISYYHENVYQPAIEQWEKKGGKQSLRDELPESLPYIVIVIDELSDCMQAYPSEIEACLVRLAQMSRMVGIHLLVATSRPSGNVLTGSIKSNLPTRFAFMTASYVDSRAILDMNGAEELKGGGDMLFRPSLEPKPIRIQSLYISEDEIKKRVSSLIKANEIFSIETLDFGDRTSNDSVFNSMIGGGEDDDLYEDAKLAVIEAGAASTSYIQRKLRIGYSRAARLLDLLEENNVIGPQDGSKPRAVYTFSVAPVAGGGSESNDLYEAAKQLVIEAGKASASYIQRKLRIGYVQTARLMDSLEENGVIGPANGSKPRDVLKDE